MAGRGKILLGAVVALAASVSLAQAQQCGNDGAGFEAWKGQFAQRAASNGVGQRGVSALQGTSYATRTIAADRKQGGGFTLTLDQFLERRGGNAIVSRGTQLKRQNADLLARIERVYGVPAGPLMAIWGMETGFGGFLGNENILSAVATLAYDCRRSEFFSGHLIGALQLVDQGNLNPAAKGAAHGEIGQTQFLPANVVRYGVDGDGDGRIDLINSRADALASTANFLRGHGWRAGAGYQPGEPNFAAIQGWNAASVYQQAIAVLGRQIDAN
ncbi:lytic murein transglycosylase [Aliihoeflea sp. 2WW]|uniref:lytic murein transglycosylase n=1 Tax=Aliihoeflea sp. 2WW TaxID=1381123 RepID=UPI000466829E|nr:lytic murein transglycosylase [Aliihoeflea sp. 2WW]